MREQKLKLLFSGLFNVSFYRRNIECKELGSAIYCVIDTNSCGACRR